MPRMHTIAVDSAKKEVNLEVFGKPNLEGIELFLKEYNSAVNSINPKEYTLNIDGREMAIIPPDLIHSLKDAFQLYMSGGFSKTILTVKNPIVKQQCERARKMANFNTCTIVDAK